MMTASRGVILWALASAMVVAPAVIWGASWAGQQRIRVMRAVQRAAVFVAIALTILVGIFPQEVGSRLAIYTETLSPFSSKSELSFRSQEYPCRISSQRLTIHVGRTAMELEPLPWGAVRNSPYACSADECWRGKRLWPAGNRAWDCRLALVDYTGLCNHPFRVASCQESERNGVVSNRVCDSLVRLSAGLPNELLRFHCLPGLHHERLFLADAWHSVPGCGISKKSSYCANNRVKTISKRRPACRLLSCRHF